MTTVESTSILLVVAWVTLASRDSGCTLDCVTTLSVAVLMLFTRGITPLVFDICLLFLAVGCDNASLMILLLLLPTRLLLLLSILVIQSRLVWTVSGLGIVC